MPSVIGPVARKFVKNFVRNRLGPRRYPQLASLEFTRQCNSKCAFCPIGVEKPELKGKDLPTEKVFSILDQFDEMGIVAFTFLGGEPTLRKDLVEVAEHAEKRNLVSQLTTNGMLLADKAEALTKGLDVIVVSMDATNAEDYYDLRGVEYFDKVVEGIRECVRFKDENDCAILTNTVVCAQNVEKIPDIVKFNDSLGVDGMMVDFATIHDYWKGMVTDEGLKFYRPEESDWRQSADKVQRLVPELIRMKDEYPIITSKAYLNTFTQGPDPKYKCHAWVFACVNHKGEVAVPCWDSRYTQFYSIVGDKRLKDVWFTDETAALRKKVEDCTECYMHCIVEPSKVLGEPTRNMGDLYEWVKTFYRAGRREAHHRRTPVATIARTPFGAT